MTRAKSPAPNSSPHSPRFSRRKLLQVLARGAVGLGVAGAGGWAYAHNVEPSRLRINRRDISIAGLPRALEGLTIAHLTDLHLNHWMTSERLSGVMRKANSLGADVIVVTGDFVSRDLRTLDTSGRPIGDAYTKAAPGLVDALSILEAPLGVWGVLGNHDHWTAHPETNPNASHKHAEPSQHDGENLVRTLLREAGVRELNNEIAPIERGGARLWLCGIDDLWVGRPDFPSVIVQLQERAAPEEVAILMAHEPDYADIVAQSGRIALQLSGHSHGGQVCLPLIGPPVLPSMGRKYHTGLYKIPTPKGSEVATMQVFTSRGVGVVGLRVRFNCPPEIALLTLRAA